MDNNNVVNINEMKDKKDWEAFAKQQVSLILKIEADNKSLKKNSEHLETLLNQVPANVKDMIAENTRLKDRIAHLESLSSLTVGSLTLASNEEELCKIEISRLFNAAKNGPLTMEEVKIFEIYTKTLLAIKGKTVNEAKNSSNSKSKLTEKELLQIALQTVSNESEQ